MPNVLSPMHPGDSWIIDNATSKPVGIQMGSSSVQKILPSALTDSTGNMTAIAGPDGVAFGARGLAIAVNTTLTAAHLEQVLDCTAAVTLTIPTDAVLGISSATARLTVASYQVNAGAVTWAGSGITINGTPKTAGQYVFQGLMRTGPNTWVYL